MQPGPAIVALWVIFCVSWLVAAGWSRRVEKRMSVKGQLGYRLVMIAGGLILLPRADGYAGPLRLWSATRGEAWTGVVLIAGGCAFSLWARIHLGELWSGWITRKAGHRIVDTGPYAIVRHPIYTGILLAIFATAAVKGTIPALLGALIIAFGMWMKARLEERWLRAELDPGAYDDYRRRVPMLIPFGPK